MLELQPVRFVTLEHRARTRILVVTEHCAVTGSLSIRILELNAGTVRWSTLRSVAVFAQRTIESYIGLLDILVLKRVAGYL